MGRARMGRARMGRERMGRERMGRERMGRKRMESVTGYRKALFFTIDALIAALIMVAGLLMITSSYVSEQPKSMINTISEDMLNILAEMQVFEVNNSFVQSLVANGSVTDVNHTLLEQIGEFWANGNDSLANEFAMNVSEGMLSSRFGYSIIMDNETIYTRSNPVRNSLVTSKRIITGIQKSKPVKGFIAKARATAVSKTTSMVVPFSPAGAGWSGDAAKPSFVQVIKYFELPDVGVLNATAYLSLHLDRGSPDWDIVVINEGLCNITRDDMDLAPGSEGIFRMFQLNASCFVTGNNSIRLELRNLGYNAHIHPGTFFVIRYNQTSDPVILSWEHSDRYYFDNVNSTDGGSGCAGPWGITAFHIPETATELSVSIQVAGRSIYDYDEGCQPARQFWGWGSNHCKSDFDYIMFLNDDEPFDSDDAPAAEPLYRYGPSDIGSRIVNGTNIIAVYFNNYEDTCWGEESERIYSDPEGDPDGSSYVEVNYTAPPALPYGVIEIRHVEEFGGEPNYSMDKNFTFPADSEGVSSVFVHPIEQYSYITQVYSDTGFPPGNMVFESPSSRATPSDVYIPLSTLDDTPLIPNYVRIVEASWNDVLPNSTVDYGFYMKSFVGYGLVFQTHSEAVEDAIERLEEILGPYVDVTDMVFENTTMSGVPSLWGPAVAEVRVWD
ncbi:hypothetical protein KY362_00455 [Candidatus Woesearchaeota archaeon]|nr:hypothetical protein [Candidatus Woesearchaeota archaeon]